MAAHPGVADHQVLDRGPLGVAEMQRAGHVRRRLDDRERRQAWIGRRTGAVRREDVGGQPALVDRALDLGRSVGLRELGRRPGRSSCASDRDRQKRKPARPADERVVVPPAGSASVRRAHRATAVVRRPLDALSGVTRHGSRATFMPDAAARLTPSRARFGAVPALLLSVVAVKAASVARALPTPAGAGSGHDPTKGPATSGHRSGWAWVDR